MGDFLLHGEPVRGRSCGSCRLCCTLLPVELATGNWSPAGEPCKHECSKGCAIYENRPTVCRLWSCRWLFDAETAALRRPDKTHFVIDAMPDEIKITDNQTGAVTMLSVIQVWVDPARREAWRDPALLDYLAAMARDYEMAALIRWSPLDALTVFAPAFSADGAWQEMEGAMSRTIGNFAQHPEDGRPPL